MGSSTKADWMTEATTWARLLSGRYVVLSRTTSSSLDASLHYALLTFRRRWNNLRRFLMASVMSTTTDNLNTFDHHHLMIIATMEEEESYRADQPNPSPLLSRLKGATLVKQGAEAVGVSFRRCRRAQIPDVTCLGARRKCTNYRSCSRNRPSPIPPTRNTAIHPPRPRLSPIYLS
jgi:hypothetical protein